MINFLLTLIAIVAIIGVIAVVCIYLKEHGSEADYLDAIASVKNFLLFAVTQAEKEMGSGTGKLKLSYVYNMFLSRFPDLYMLIPFELFSQLVDEVLAEFRNMLETNKNIENYVKKDAE